MRSRYLGGFWERWAQEARTATHCVLRTQGPGPWGSSDCRLPPPLEEASNKPRACCSSSRAFLFGLHRSSCREYFLIHRSTIYSILRFLVARNKTPVSAFVQTTGPVGGCYILGFGDID